MKWDKTQGTWHSDTPHGRYSVTRRGPRERAFVVKLNGRFVAWCRGTADDGKALAERFAIAPQAPHSPERQTS